MQVARCCTDIPEDSRASWDSDLKVRWKGVFLVTEHQGILSEKNIRIYCLEMQGMVRS